MVLDLRSQQPMFPPYIVRRDRVKDLSILHHLYNTEIQVDLVQESRTCGVYTEILGRFDAEA